MTKRRSLSKSHNTSRKHKLLPNRWTPAFLEDADGRYGVIQEMKERIRRMEEDTGADNIQKKMLCQRAVFLATMLETYETNLLRGEGEYDSGKYAQTVNALTGVLSKLGIDKKQQSKTTLQVIAQNNSR